MGDGPATGWGTTMRSRLWLGAAATLPLIGLAITSGAAAPAGAASAHHSAHAAGAPTTGLAAGNPFCKRLQSKRYWASAGAHTFCFGPQLSGPAAGHAAVSRSAGAPANVNAASFAEDVSPAGARAYGQSETSIAASGPFVVEAWNDATSFLSACPSPMAKEEGTGFGFSANGGKSFTDLGGLPNANCNKDLFEGDPSVAAYRVGGSTYFYISSLFDPPTGLGLSKIAMDACKVVGSGSGATLACGQPITVGMSSQCQKFRISRTRFGKFCSFVDKDFMAIDPASGRLYVSYSDFLIKQPFPTQVDLAACDIGNASGGPGPAGGTPAAPVCKNGTVPVPVTPKFFQGKPYFVVAKPDPNGCENEGSYPAVDPANGAVYTAYEFNIDTNLFVPQCFGAATPTANVMTRTPQSCLPLATFAACGGPKARISVPITSLDAAFVPGYNRFPVNDFPRLAVSDHYDTVSMVWNDTRFHPLGDILLQSFHGSSLVPVQAHPVVLDRPASGGLHMLPALRTATAAGRLDVTWYSRSTPTAANTNVDGVLGLSPVTTSPPASNVRITNVASNWLTNTSDIAPNFGDYTDAVLTTTGTPPFVGSTLYVAWSDGRFSVPQPFEAHLPG
jgi:hypothetical protein